MPAIRSLSVEAASGLDASLRELSVEAAAGLDAGVDHYRAYVGPPGRFDILSSLQMAILHFLGLRDTDLVLDVGCGSLRVGRLLIPYLQADRYFGIEPNGWLVEEGLDRELGRDAAAVKRPRFDGNDRFDLTVFREHAPEGFDVIIAQSVLTHTGVAPARALLSGVRQALKPGGLAVVNWFTAPQDSPDIHSVDWLYPGCHDFSAETIAGLYAEAGLAWRVTPWWHPAPVVRWDLLALDESAIPAAEELARADFRPAAR